MATRLVGSALLLLGLWGLWGTGLRGETFVTKQGDAVLIYEGKPDHSAVLVVYSVFQDRETGLPLARALHRSGFTTLTYKLQPGRSFSSYLDSLREGVDLYAPRGRVYAVGHSMGADLVTTLASSDQRIACVAALGFPVDTSLLSCPVLVAAGAWDQVHSGGELGPDAFLSPWSDHSQEPLDPRLAQACVEHFQESFVPQDKPNRVISKGLVFWGFVMLCVGFPRPRKPRLVGALVIATVFMGCWFGDGTIPMALVLILARANAGWKGTGLAWLRPTLTIVATVALSWLIYRVGNWWPKPELLLGLPVSVLTWFPVLAARLAGAWPLVATLAAAEMLKPGILLKGVSSGLRALQKRPLALSLELDKRSAGVLGILLGVAGLLWLKVGAAGYLPTAGEAARLLWIFIVLLGMPITLLVVALRQAARRGS